MRSWRQTLGGDFVPDDPHPDTPFLRVYNSAALQRYAGEWWSANYFIVMNVDYVSFWRRFYTPSHTATFVHAGSVDLVGPSGIRSGVAPYFARPNTKCLGVSCSTALPGRRLWLDSRCSDNVRGR